MPPNSPLRDPASRDYLKRQQEQSDALMQQSRQNAEDDERRANEAQRQQEQQARENERQQNAQQRETLRAQNVQAETLRQQTFAKEQATKNQAKADALRFQQEGRKFTKNPIDGSTIPLQSDAAVEAARQAKAEAARRSVIDRNLQALKTEADDPALASAALTESARKQAERALIKKRDEARYALQAKLGQQATAKTGTADWVPFNENPTPEALAATERLKRLEDPNADLDDEDLALLESDPTTASTAAAVRNLKTRLAQADEAGKKITTAKTRIWEEEMRRDNPEKYREMQRQKLLADPTAIEGAAKDFEARKTALETTAAEISAQRQQSQQQIADIEALNTQRMAEGVPAADLIQMSGPDGQPQPWSKELAAQRATLEAQAQAWDVEQEPRLLELQAEEEDLKATAALINEAQQGRQKQAEAQRQQTFASLAQQPGGKALVANLTALDAERAQRVADLQKLPEGSPERQAAEATLQGDLAAKAQQVQEAHGAERQAAAKFYAYLKEFDPQTDWTKPDRSLDQVLRNASAKSGIDPETAKQYLPSLAERDWTAGDTKATSRVTSDGQLLINPTLASDAEAYKKAVESAKATPEAKQAALDQLPAAEKDLAAAALPILAVQEDNPLFARNAAAFVKALENPTAAARLLQGSLTGMADSLPSFNQFVEIISEKQPDFAGKSPADQAAAYLRMTKGRGVLSKYQDQILSGLINGTAAIPQQIAGAVAALTGNESAANVAATLSQGAQIDQQRLALTGANDAPGAQLAGSLASTVPSLAVAFAGGMVGQTLGRVGVALRAAAKGDDIVAALTKGSAALYQQAAGVAGSSVAGGLQSLGGFYADAYQTFRERGQDHLTAHQNAAAPAMLAGMGTALLTLAGGATGVEKVFAAKGGADAVKAAVRTRWQAIMGGIVKEAGSEGLEEGFDQLWQGFLDQAAVNPSKTVKEIFAEALEAGAIGGILGGAIGGIQAAGDAAPVTPPPLPNPANLPETVAAAEQAIDALNLPDLDPQTLARTQEAARSVLYIAQGSPLTDLPADSLAALDIIEDPKKPGQFINGTIVAGKDGGTKLVTYTGGQVSDPATGALRPVRVRMENGQPIISQTTLDKLETILPAVRAAIPLNENERKNQVRTPAPTVQPPADAQEAGIPSPSGSGNTQAPSNQNAGPAAPIAEESSVVDPAATERTNQLSLHLAELGLPPAQAETVAQAMVAKRGVVGTEYVEQVTSKEFIADLKALGISGSLSSVKAKENPLKAGPDLAQRLATFSPSPTLPVSSPPPLPQSAPVKTRISEQPSKTVQPRATQSVPPRPPRVGRDTTEKDVWDEAYGDMRKGGRTHNNDGSPYQPTVFDETMPLILASLASSGNTDEQRLDAVGDQSETTIASSVRRLLNAGWVWDADSGKMVNPNNPSEKPLDFLVSDSAPVETPPAIPPVQTGPTSDSSISAQGAATPAQGGVDIPQGEAKATPADASPVPVSGIDADAYLTARQAAMKAVPVAKRKDAVKLLGGLDKALNRYGSVFSGVRFVTTPGGGLAVNRAGGKTYLDIDLGQWVSQHTNLVDKAGVVALTELEEEFIHRAASAVFTDADMSGFFRGLPADLQRMVYKGYHVADIASKAMPAEPPAEFEDSKAVQLGHEFLRMLVQDSTFNGRVSEAIAADPGLGEKIIAFLQKLVSNLRKLIDKADTDTRVTIAEYEKRVTNEVNRLKKLLPDPLKAKETPTNLADTQDNRASVSSSPSPQVSSSPSLAPILGATYTAYTDSNDAIEVQWAVVDVNSLVLSNEDDGRINPAYPQELQPRDRTSAGSEAQVADIAKNFNLDRLSASNGVGDGAPIIGPDGIVESGNGRGMGARRAYTTGKPSAASYRDALMRRASEFGLNAEQVEAVQNPVLVRIRRTDVNRPAFVLAANVSTIAPKRDIEQAKIDAGQIVPDLFESYVPSEDGDIFTAANADFIKGYISTVIPPAERPAVIDARGNLSQAGLRRIRNALFVHAYGKSPEALNALARLTESVDAADTNIARALIAMAPRFGEQNARIAAGALQPLSITEELTAALQILSDLKNRGEKVTDWLAQDRIPGIGEDPGPVGTALVQYLHENRQRPRQIIDTLARYASAVDAAGDPRQMSMFGDDKPDKLTLWSLASKTADRATALAKSSVSPNIPADTALKLYRTLTAKQKEGALTPGQAQALEQAERSLGQLFLFDEATPRTFKPAEALTLESDVTNPTPATEQLRLFASSKSPVSFITPLVNPQNETILSRNENDTADSHRNPSVALRLVQGSVSRGQEQAVNGERPQDGSQDRGGSGSSIMASTSARGIRALPELDADALSQGLRSIPESNQKQGQEHLVYLDTDSDRAIKLTAPGEMGARQSLPGYLTQMQAMADLFQDGLAIEGWVQVPGETGPRLITTQPWVHGRESTLEEIETLMRRKGFLRMYDGAWWHSGQEMQVTDALPKNFITSATGHVHPIDLIFAWPPVRAHERIENIVNSQPQPPPLPEPTDETPTGSNTGLRLDALLTPGQQEAKNNVPSLNASTKAVRQEQLKGATTTVQGQTVHTGTPVTFRFLHNQDSATKRMGKPKRDSDFDRGFEPSGRFVTETTDPWLAEQNPDQYVTGTLTFENPIVIDSGEYGTDSSWKRRLSSLYSGKRGKNLSKAILADGFDGIITSGKYGPSEIVDLTTFDESKALYKSTVSPQQDADYLAAVNAGDMETAQRMVDAAAKAEGYDRRRFHQTARANVEAIYREGFDLSKGLARLSDNEVPDGVFLKPDTNDIGLGAVGDSVQMPVFAKMANPLFVNSRADLLQWASANPEYKSILLDLKELDADRSDDFKKLRENKRLWARTQTPEYEAAKKATDQFLSDWAQDVNRLSGKARAVLTQDLKKEGFDGVILFKDAGSFGRETRTEVVLDTRAVKSADPVTYDSAGKVIPLSERFNPKENSILYKSTVSPAEARFQESYGSNANLLYPFTLGGDTQEIPVTVWNNIPVPDDSAITAAETTRIGRALYRLSVIQRPDGQSYAQAEKFRVSDGFPEDLGGTFDKLEDSDIENNVTLNDRTRKLWESTRAQEGQLSLFKSSVQPTRPQPRLSALHNLSIENLVFADRMGGLAVPSIAVTPEGQGMSGFGGITLIGTRDLVDPRQEPVFDSDAYSPRFPDPEYPKAKSSAAMKVDELFRPFADRFEDRRIIDTVFDNAVNRPRPQETLRHMETSMPARAAFLASQGVDVQPVMRPMSMEASFVTQPAFAKYRENPALISQVDANDTAAMRQIGQDIRAAIDEETTIESETSERRAFLNDSYLSRYIDPETSMPHFGRLMRVEKGLAAIGKQQVDRGETSNRLAEAMEGKEPEFKAWAENLILPLHGAPSLTVKGRKQPYTLENIVTVMTGRVRGREDTMAFGEGVARAAVSKRFKDMDQMRTAATDQIMPQAEIKASRAEAQKLLEQYREAVSNYTSLTNYLGAPDYFAAMDASMRALVTWAKGKKDIATLASALRREGFKDVPQDVLEQGQTAAQAWLKSPVPYFEAKPQRAVRLSEFAGAVIPESSPVGVKNILDKHNIAYRTYDTEANQATTAAAWAQELAQQGQATLFKSSVALTPSDTLPDIPGWQAYQDSLSAARQGATDPTAAKAQTQAITEAYFRDNPNAQATIDARKALSQTVGRPIPPAWTQVQTYPPGSRLLVKGRDSKNRWQSIYSSEETQASLASKFARAKRVNALMPRILDGVKAGLAEGTEEASVLRLIYLSGFRNGGEGDTGAKVKAYGATTLLAEHVSIDGDTVSFDFIGKLGVRQQHEITDAALAADLSARKAKGGRLFATSPEKVLAALRTAAGTQDIKVHDLRTWNASSLALELVKANPAPETETDYWLKRDAVGDVVARKLGDTRKIVLESYIDPIVFAKWQESLTLNDDSERPKISRKQADARGASGQLQRPNAEYERALRSDLLPSPGEGGWPVRDRGLSQASLFKSSVAPTSYDTAPPDPITGIPSLITGPTTSRDQGRLIAQKHAERLRAGLRGGEENWDAGPALAADRSRAFVVPVLSTAQMDRLQSLSPIGEGAEAKVFADRSNGTVYKVLQGFEESPALGIWPDLFSSSDGKLDYAFSPATRPRQLAARIAVQSLLGGTPTEIVGIGPDGHVILKQPLSSMPDIASRDEYIDAGVRTLAKRQAGLVLIPPGMLSDPKAPSTYLAVVDGRPYLVADLGPDNFVGDTQRNARLNDVVVTNLPAQIIPRVKGLAAVVTQAGQEAARLGDRANRLFASAKAVTSPMESNEAADQIVTNERLDEWLDTYMMNGWEDAENAIPGGGEEIAKLIAQTRPRNHDRDIHRGVNPNFGEITGRPLYSFSFQKETAQLAGGAGAKVTTKKGPTRYLSAEDIALARIRRDNKPHYAGQQAELFVPASELTTLAKSAVSPSPQVSEPLLSRLGNKILDAADFSMGVTSKVTQAVGLESPLQKLGWNHLDRMASAKIAALTRWTTDKTNVGEFVAKWGAHPNAQPFIGLGKGLKREFFPDSVLPREVAARKREMEIKTALGAQRGMDLVRALSGKPKFSDLAYPAEFSQNPMHRRNLYLAMTGEIPMTSLPQALQDLGGRLRDMLVDMGREAVKQGRMSTDTFANLQSGYMPHYYKEDVQREKSIIQRFRLGVRDILAQRTTAWHIVDNDTKDKTGEPRLISWQGNQWRFRNKEHRDAFYEDFILNETLSQVQARGGKAARALTLSDLRAPAKLDAELRGRIKEISLQLKMRYSKERPLDIDEQEKAGLIMDPVYSIARYTAQMVHDNSTAEFFNFVAGNKDWTSDTASPGFTEIPDNPRFGRLAGKYVTEDVSRQILEMVEAPNIALQLYDTLLGWWKTGKTVLNPGTHMRNVLGNVFFSQLAGTSVWNPGNVPYYKAALKAMRNGGPDLQEAYEMGVLGADFVSSELRQTLRQLLPDPATIADDGKPDVLLGIGKAIGRVVPDLLKNPLSKGYNQIAALYQAEDELFKLATYLKAKAMTGTPEAARDHVRTWFPYFDQGTSATLKTLGRTAMPFLGFYRESIRIFGNAVKERPIALATGLAVPSLITFLSAMLLGLDDDDVDQVKKDMRGKAGKLLGPTPFEGMPLFSMLLPVRSDTGQVQQFDISAIHPFVDFLGNRVEATTGQDWYQQMWRSMLAAGPVGSLVYSQMTGKDTFGDRTFVEENMTAMEKIGARADNLAKTILPPLAPGGTGFKTLMSAGERTTNKTFEVRSPVQAVTRAVIGLDVRNATPDLYRMADDWRKANGLPTSEGMDFGGTTPVSRARKALFAQLAQDEPNPQAIGNIKKALTTMGSPIKTPQDVQRLLFYRNPLMIIGGDKTKGLTASDAQQRFRNSLQGLEREALDQAMAEYEKIKAKAPSLLLR